MKICAIICEYNPFHNGHLYQMQLAKERSGADAILCLMSGCFVQRGEAAVMDKYTRAKHAVLAGADVVIELPTVFATANAELFAKGAISILSTIPNVTTLCFGAEQAHKDIFIKTAKLLNNEPEDVSKAIKTLTSQGVSFAKARAQAFEKYVPVDFLSSPNNILGIEYTRAILDLGCAIDILPIQRKGSGYSETKLSNNFSSATAIRQTLNDKTMISSQLPAYVLNDLPNVLENKLDALEKYAILSRQKEELAAICDCTEGLENAFKKAALHQSSLEYELTSARYTASRIRRIALHNLLGISHTFIKTCLKTPLYLRVLGIKKQQMAMLSLLSNSSLPILIRSHDEDVLNETQRACFERDIFAEQVYSLLYPIPTKKDVFID